MFSSAPSVQFQAQHHPVVTTSGFRSLEEYCLYLIHLKAYQEVADLARQRVVLDLGCNAGYGSAVLRSHAATVVGVDVSAQALQTARHVRTDHLHFVLVDGISLPFADRQFDLVTSFQVIEHIRDYVTYLSEIKRILVPGGLVAFATPNAALRLDPGMPPWNEFHVREFTAQDLYSLLRVHFPHVHVRGLFAHEPLYSVERNRVERARAAARDVMRRRTTWQYRLRSGVKSLLPQSVLHHMRNIRGMTANRQQGSLLDSSVLGQYSTANFFYADHDLEHALDLLAICSIDL